MAEFVPDRILKVNQSKILKARGTLLYADISGFTNMSEKLGLHGPAGTEDLTNVLNDYYGKMLKVLKKHNGQVLKIIGDAIVAAFYDRDMQHGMRCAEEMLEISREYDHVHTIAGDFELKAKFVGAEGSWLEFVTGDKDNADLFLSGSIIKHIAKIEKDAKKGEIIFDKFENKPVNPTSIQFTPFPETAFYFSEVAALSRLGIRGEHRVITPMFLYISGYDEDNPEWEKLENFIAKIIGIVKKYHGRLHIIDNLTDEGAKMMFLFGVPQSHGNDILNAVMSLYEISRLKVDFEIKGGINTGFGYAGIITGEHLKFYTTIGDVVNTAARLAESARWKEFVASLDVYRTTFHRIGYGEMDAVFLKGKTGHIRRFKPVRLKKEPEERIPFIGRENLLKELDTYLKETRDIIVVMGEAGSGKTRLLREFFKRHPDKEPLVLRFDSTKPLFATYREMLSRQAKITESDTLPIQKDKLHKLLTEIDSMNGELLKREEFIGNFLFNFNLKYEHSKYEDLQPKVRWQNLLEGLRLLVKYLSFKKPVFIWVDDLHEAQEEEKELLFYIIRGIYAEDIVENLRVFITLRDTKKKPLFEDIPIKTISLGALTFKESRELLNAILKKPVSDDLSKELYAKTEGIPFFIEQYALLLKEKGLLEEKDGIFIPKKQWKEAMPENIFNVIMERVDRLEEKVKDKLRIGSVIGIKFPKTPLYLLSKDTGIEREMEVVIGERLVYPEGGELEEIEYIFSHSFLRDVIYNSLLIKKRKEIHKKIADTYVKLYPDKIEQLYEIIAHHYDKGGATERAIEYYLKAGKRAKSLYNNKQALQIFERALELIQNNNKATSLLYEIYKNLAEISRLLGRGDDTIKYYEMAVREAQKLNDIKKELETKIELAEAQLYRGSVERITQELDEIAKVAEKNNLQDFKGYAYSIKCEFLTYHGQYEKAIDIASKAIDIFKATGNTIRLAYAYKNRGLAYKESGFIQNALFDYAKAYELFKENNYLSGISGMTNNLGTVYFAKGDFEKALGHFTEAYNIWKRMGDVENSAGVLINMGACYESLEKIPEALKVYEESLRIFRNTGHLFGMAVLTFNIALLKTRQNAMEEALKLLEESYRLRTKTSNKPGMVSAGRHLVELFSFLGHRQKAIEYLKQIEKVALELNSAEMYALVLESKITMLREGQLHFDIDHEISTVNSKIEKTGGDFLARYLGAPMVLYLLKGMIKEAEEVYNRAVALEEAHEETVWSIKKNYAMLLSMKGEKEEAISLYKILLEKEENYPVKLIKTYAELYRLTGNVAYIEQAKEKILTIFKSLPHDLKTTFVNKPFIKNILNG